MKEILEIYFEFLKELPKEFSIKEIKKDFKEDPMYFLLIKIFIFAFIVIGTVYGICFITKNEIAQFILSTLIIVFFEIPVMIITITK